VAWWYLVFPALPLLITTLAFNLLGGVVVVETVFGIGGIGQDSVEAIDQGNLPLIIGLCSRPPRSSSWPTSS
jgi:ABC-type dipeptide/oligopeptide/nickel transport system permease component